jgi:hypothetical protein
VPSSPFSLRERSPDFSASVVEYAIANRIRIVFLAACWNNYIRQASFEKCLHATLDALHEAGIATVIVLDVPYQDIDAPMALARSVWTGTSISRLGLPPDRWHAQVDTTNAILRRLARGKAVVLDPAPAFVSDSEGWPAVIDHRAVYFDNHHLSAYGSLRLEPLFQQILAERVGDTDPQ